tara:strand:- start:94 stop:582 length:489 start_codon:yes stop_codon:yes gene_type:complete
MNAMESAWMVLKGNPDARVQNVKPADGNLSYSTRDFAIHPAALGAANRQSYAESENRKTLRDFAQQHTGQIIPQNTLQDTARQMVTPEQRASMRNNSFDLHYKNPRFVHKIKPDLDVGELTDGEKEARKIEAMGAKARRKEGGFSQKGLTNHNRRRNNNANA